MISVIIPAYNEETALPGALPALFAQPGEFETILVDGGSTDRTRAIAESFGFADRMSNDGESFLGTRDLIQEFRVSSCTVRDDSNLNTELETRNMKQHIHRFTFHASRLFLSAPKGRASQMNAGSKEASGCFFSMPIRSCRTGPFSD